MKRLSEYAKTHGVTYRTAFNHFKAGLIQRSLISWKTNAFNLVSRLNLLIRLIQVKGALIADGLVRETGMEFSSSVINAAMPQMRI